MPTAADTQSALEVLRCHACGMEIPMGEIRSHYQPIGRFVLRLTCPRCGGHQWGEIEDA